MTRLQRLHGTALLFAALAACVPIRSPRAADPMSPTRSFLPPPTASEVALLDLDRDGRDDIVSLGAGVSGIQLLSVQGFTGAPSRYGQRDAMLLDGYNLMFPIARSAWAQGPAVAVWTSATGVAIYRGVPLQRVQAFTGSCAKRQPTGIGDVDGDGDLDAFGLESGNPFVCDLATDVIALQGATGPCAGTCTQVLAAQLDDDAALELILDGNPSRVVDGATFQNDWLYPGMMRPLVAGQLDGDGREEFVAQVGEYSESIDTQPYTPVADVHEFARAIGDLDHDGIGEVIAGFPPRSIYSGLALQPAGSLPIDDYPQKAAIAQLDDDPAGEVVTFDAYVSGPSLTVYDGITHAREWRQFGSNGDLSPLVVADVDADGKDDVVVGAALADPSDVARWLRVLDRETLQLKWERYDQVYPTSSFTAIAVAQLDADPALEIIAANGSDIEVIDGATGATQWRLRERGGSSVPYFQQIQRMIYADVEGIGRPELVVADSTLGVWAFDIITGATLWHVDYATNNTRFAGLEIYQVDADAAAEILLSTSASTVLLDGATRAVQWHRDSPGGPSAWFAPRGGPPRLFLVESQCIIQVDPATGVSLAAPIGCNPYNNLLRVLDWPEPVLLVAQLRGLALLSTQTSPGSAVATMRNVGFPVASFSIADLTRKGATYSAVVGSSAGVFEFSLADPLILFSDDFEDHAP